MNAEEIAALRTLRGANDMGSRRIRLEKIACQELDDYGQTAEVKRDGLLALFQEFAPSGMCR